jgi:hypothetical protein
MVLAPCCSVLETIILLCRRSLLLLVHSGSLSDADEGRVQPSRCTLGRCCFRLERPMRLASAFA